MDERLKLVLLGFTALCAVLAVYLAFVIKDGPKPAHEIRQAMLNDKQSAVTEVNCGSGAPPGRLNQADSSVANR